MVAGRLHHAPRGERWMWRCGGTAVMSGSYGWSYLLRPAPGIAGEGPATGAIPRFPESAASPVYWHGPLMHGAAETVMRAHPALSVLRHALTQQSPGMRRIGVQTEMTGLSSMMT